MRVEGGKAVLGVAVPQRGDMIATGFTGLAWREALLNFSDPVFPSQALLVTRSEAPALRDAYNAHLWGINANGRYDRRVDKYYPGARNYFPEFFAEVRPAE